MTKLLKKLAAAAITAVAASGASASLLIDGFLDDQLVFDLTSSNSTIAGTAYSGGSYNQFCGASILGGCREIYVQKTAGGDSANPLQNNVVASSNSLTNKFAFTSGQAPNSGFAVIRWDGAQEIANTGITAYDSSVSNTNFLTDLTAFGDAFVFTYTADLAFTVRIELWDTAGNFVGQDFMGVGGNVETSDFFAFSDFPPGVIDFTQLSGLQVIINPNGSTVSLDLSFSSITADTVPEPSSILLTGMALAGLGAIARRRRKV